MAQVSLKERFVRWLEKACVFLDDIPAFWYDRGGGFYYHSLGDVWHHPAARLSQFLDARWHTDTWQVKEAS